MNSIFLYKISPHYIRKKKKGGKKKGGKTKKTAKVLETAIDLFSLDAYKQRARDYFLTYT